MAYFLKCKQETIIQFKVKKELIKVGKIMTRWFSNKKISDDEYVEEKVSVIYENPVINLDNVCDIEKNLGLPDYDVNGNIIANTQKPGLVFFYPGNSHTNWYYDSIEARAEQLAEISSNNHLFRSKVIL